MAAMESQFRYGAAIGVSTKEQPTDGSNELQWHDLCSVVIPVTQSWRNSAYTGSIVTRKYKGGSMEGLSVETAARDGYCENFPLKCY